MDADGRERFRTAGRAEWRDRIRRGPRGRMAGPFAGDGYRALAGAAAGRAAGTIGSRALVRCARALPSMPFPAAARCLRPSCRYAGAET